MNYMHHLRQPGCRHGAHVHSRHYVLDTLSRQCRHGHTLCALSLPHSAGKAVHDAILDCLLVLHSVHLIQHHQDATALVDCFLRQR